MSTVTMEPRPKTVPSITKRVKLACGSLYITITHKDGKIFEVFVSMGKAGGCLSACLNALAISISLAVRSGVDPSLFIEFLKDIKCPSPTWEEGRMYSSCVDALAQCMEETQKKLSEGEYESDITTIQH